MENVLESLQPNARNRFGNLQNVQAEYRQILHLYLRKFPWRRQEIENFEWKENETIYNIHQLNTAKDVETEGKVMSHCVGSYVAQCMDGRCSIWSMTYTMPNGFKDRMVTIEVRDKKVVQVKGKSNRPANVKELDVLKQWKRVAKLA